MCNMSLKMKVNELAPVENINMYIPVADATFGGSPRLSSNGLKIEPPPSPSAPETKPPAKDNAKTLNFLPTRLTSEAMSPSPYLILSYCSYSSTFKLFKLMKTQIPTKTANDPKSCQLQVLIPKMLGSFFDPRNRSMKSRTRNKQTFIIYFLHCLWPFSSFKTFFNFAFIRRILCSSAGLRSFGPSASISLLVLSDM